MGACLDLQNLGCPIENDFAVARNDLHALGRTRAEVVFTGINQADCFFGAVLKVDRMGNNAAIKVNIGLGVDGNIGEGGCTHGRKVRGLENVGLVRGDSFFKRSGRFGQAGRQQGLAT